MDQNMNRECPLWVVSGHSRILSGDDPMREK